MSDHLTDEQLDAMRARAEAATEGPWEAEVDGTVTQHWTRDEPWVTVVNNDVACASYCLGGSVRPIDSEADAEFIAAARSDVPALIAEVRRLRAQRREALALANVGVAQWERDNHTPAVWAADIRDALEADDE